MVPIQKTYSKTSSLKARYLSQIWSWRFRIIPLFLKILIFSLRCLRLPGQSFLNELLQILQFCHTPLERPTFYVTRYVEIPLGISSLACNTQEKILDLGSGTSPLPLYLRYRDHTIIAFDHSLKELKNLRTLSQYETDDPKPLMLINGDLRKLPFHSNVFDKIFCVSTIEHIPEDGDTESMKEIWRILKPGGHLFLSTEFEQPESLEQKSGDIVFCRRYSPQSFAQRIVQSAPWEIKNQGIFSKPLWMRRFYDIDQKSKLKTFLDFLAPLTALFFLLFKNRSQRIPKGSFGFAVLEKSKE
jgi:ubiquinone/menaquinone biosynthesis C-methylase UbiE